ncbi:MAG TPA: pentapeptide repeat-containing protein [Methylocella sp.]|nr:pentapeptide repeat-containing protein [Methylocella sp.]
MVEDTKAEGEAPEPEKQKAEDNPWYLLATLYGVPDRGYQALQDKNRIAWNRYYAGILDEITRKKLVTENRHTGEELTPFSGEELEQILNVFEARCGVKGKKPPEARESTDFSNVKFESSFDFSRFLFNQLVSFHRATFAASVTFESATFLGQSNFARAIFSSGADFASAMFMEWAFFYWATFSHTGDL